MRRVLPLLLAMMLAVALGAATASATLHPRSCGYLQWGIGWSLRATPNLSCTRARRLFKQCSFRSCSAGLRCSERTDQVSGVTTRTCARRKQEIIGKGGP
jgi:hypothetical protein